MAALAMMNIHPMPAVSVAQARAWHEQRLGSYCLEKVSVPIRFDEEDWLDSQLDGNFLFRLGIMDCSGEEIGHVVVLDTQRQLMYDYTERFALNIGPGTLSACLRHGVDLLGIPELRRLTKQPVGKRKRHGGGRKISTEVQRK